MAVPVPDLSAEERLFQGGARSVAGIDEVGRGAWAGPVSVGVVVITEATTPFPAGLRDSKLLSARAREMLAPAVMAWADDWAVGNASPAECDDLGMRSAIALAASRAMEDLRETPDAVIVDGPLDLLYPSSLGLSAAVAEHRWRKNPPATVEAVIKADQTCATVSAASVIAKVARDAHMAALADSYPAFDLDRNAGYPSSTHQTALRGYGLTPLHRRSWKFTDIVPWERSSEPEPPRRQG
jgi:ribonuclease HII